MEKTCTLLANVDGWRDFHSGKDYGVCAIRLARSLRKNGGKCKNMNLVFWHPDNNSPSHAVLDELRDLGCKIVTAPISVSTNVLAKRLRIGAMAKDHKSYTDALFCTLSACQMEFDTDYTLYLNVDSYIMGDFSGIFEDAEIDMKVIPAQWSYEGWCREEDMKKVDEFYSAFGHNRDKSLMTVSQVDGKECNFYFYSVAIMYKNGIGFGKRYEGAARAVLSKIKNVKRDHLAIVLIQVPIGMVIQKYGLTYDTIPLEMIWNYGAHDHTVIGNPAIVHYQWQKFPGVDESIWEVTWK